MRGSATRSSFICFRCVRAGGSTNVPKFADQRRAFSRSLPQRATDSEPSEKVSQDGAGREEQGAMSRRLSELTEESFESRGRSARKAVEEAGFSEDLKRRLEDRIAGATFKSDHASAFAEANLPSSAGEGTRVIAGAQAWTGTESVGDASLRMLNDAYKPMKGPAKLPPIRGPPAKIDTGRSRNKASSGSRLANARDKTSMYAYLKDPSMSEQEREEVRKQLKERFKPASRAVPATIQGLNSLANERIEDAIARGQFKNLPRGKKIERDYTASSPFLDTTEYFMHQIMQRQDIVPPWIEKQQEVVSTANKFRARLRSDWKRHVARSISSGGGSLKGQIRLAKAYAAAEAIDNPTKAKVESLNTVDEGGQLSQITLAGELKPADVGLSTDQPSQITVTERPVDPSGEIQPPEQQLTIRAETTAPTFHEQPAEPLPSVPPFRDEMWLETERSYQALAIQNLNSMTRSYNLMAPNLAKKPYYNLERELRSCYADVAPQVADEILHRARAPKLKVEVIGHRPGGVLERFGGETVKVFDERKPQYGFKQFWKDLFSKEA